MQWAVRQWRHSAPWTRDSVHDVSARYTSGRASGRTSPRTAFILPGGGARGAAQAGALDVLLRAGLTPDLIIASSAGSWNGAYLALHPTAEATRQLAQFWRETSSRDVLGTARWRLALNVIGRRRAVFTTTGMAQVAERRLGDHAFADCVVPLHIVAADLTTGEPHFFSQGRLLDAVLASSAMPGIFPPVTIDGETYVDGGIVDWAACLLALEAGAERICLVSCGSRQLRPLSSRQTFRHVFERSMEVSARDGFARTVFALRRSGVDLIAVHPDVEEGGLLDFDHASDLLAAGQRAAEMALAEWEAAREASRVASRSATTRSVHATVASARRLVMPLGGLVERAWERSVVHDAWRPKLTARGRESTPHGTGASGATPARAILESAGS